MQQSLIETPTTPRRKSPRRDPYPRFKPDQVGQLDPIRGCAEFQVPSDHLAREVRDLLSRLDFSELESRYSSLGRRGFHPRQVLGVLVYGSLIGVHHSTKLEHVSKTDAAFRLVSGGHWISAGKLREFRRKHLAFFLEAIQQTLVIARERGLLDPEQLAVDSVRLRAHASTKAARTLRRSRERLVELAKVDGAALTPDAQKNWEEKRAKHEAVVAMCEQTGRTNLVTTAPSAGLLKFPDGASAPGHRMTVTACGVKTRMVVDILVDADGHDFGKLPVAVERARSALAQAGVDVTHVQVAADAGYWSEADLAFAAANRDHIDVLVAERKESARRNDAGKPQFTAGNFEFAPDGSVTCPAGRRLDGPFKDGEKLRYHGVGCGACPQKDSCTKGTKRILTLKPEYQKTQQQMAARMAQPGAHERYGKRIATVEPVFAQIEDRMGFRRLSSRHEPSVLAELALKVLAYNLGRLMSAQRLCRVRAVIAFSSTL
jgi:transposase